MEAPIDLNARPLALNEEVRVGGDENPYDKLFMRFDLHSHHLEFVRDDVGFPAGKIYKLVEGPLLQDDVLYQTSKLKKVMDIFTRTYQQALAANAAHNFVNTLPQLQHLAQQGIATYEEIIRTTDPEVDRLRGLVQAARQQKNEHEQRATQLRAEAQALHNEYIQIQAAANAENARMAQIPRGGRGIIVRQGPSQLQAAVKRITNEPLFQQKLAEANEHDRIASDIVHNLPGQDQQLYVAYTTLIDAKLRKQMIERIFYLLNSKVQTTVAERQRQAAEAAAAAEAERQRLAAEAAAEAERQRLAAEAAAAAEQQRLAAEAAAAEEQRRLRNAEEGRRRFAEAERRRYGAAARAAAPVAAAPVAAAPVAAARGAAGAGPVFENVVVGDYIDQNTAFARIEGRLKADATREEKATIFEAIPIESRRINEKGMVEVEREDFNRLVEIVNPTIPLPITLDKGIELQHVIRQLDNPDRTQMTEAELADGDYCRPEPMVEGATCFFCIEDETPERRLFKIHYTHDDEESSKACLSCIFKTIKGKSEELGVEITGPNAGLLPCFLNERQCARKVTEYMLYRTIWYNQTDQKLAGIAPLRLDGAGQQPLVREALVQYIVDQRERFNAERRRMKAAYADRAQNIHRGKIEKLARNTNLYRRDNKKYHLIWDTLAEIEPYRNIVENKAISMCPYCFFIGGKENPDGCIYMYHDGGKCFWSQSELAKRYFPIPVGRNPQWCQVCCRPCGAPPGAVHAHFKLDGRGFHPLPVGGQIYYAKDGFTEAAVCKRTGGGERKEFVLRLLALRDELIDAYTKDKFVMDDELRDKIFTRTQSYVAGPQKDAQMRRAEAIMRERRWDTPLPQKIELPGAAPRVEEGINRGGAGMRAACPAPGAQAVAPPPPGAAAPRGAPAAGLGIPRLQFYDHPMGIMAALQHQQQQQRQLARLLGARGGAIQAKKGKTYKNNKRSTKHKSRRQRKL